jgi:hypothetical protein
VGQAQDVLNDQIEMLKQELYAIVIIPCTHMTCPLCAESAAAKARQRDELTIKISALQNMVDTYAERVLRRKAQVNPPLIEGSGISGKEVVE